MDPDGREVDITFEVTSYEKTSYGWMAKGILTVTDRDTKKSISVNAYSGGLMQTMKMVFHYLYLLGNMIFLNMEGILIFPPRSKGFLLRQ